ncbi:MAG: hypothetical protein OFPII_05680 [Osedax symbiont Rs1]|nr:MAG: hypothetical protein OFPII_05680 [Osedax symbiont Rs1]
MDNARFEMRKHVRLATKNHSKNWVIYKFRYVSKKLIADLLACR